MNQTELHHEINKRLTLNWLIQGAAQHAGMTAHHLVRDELDAIHPKLLRLYDQFALMSLLQYWHFDMVLIMGWPTWFWRRAASSRRHPFFNHPVLSRHGGMLAATAKQRAVERCKEKGVWNIPVLFMLQTIYVFVRTRNLESSYSEQLIELAKKVTAMVWGIPTNRLHGALTTNVAFGKLSMPRSIRGCFMRLLAMGYGGVLRGNGELKVVANAANWWILVHELVKGTAELICLHGLNNLSDETYKHVVRQTDRIEFEPWMLQSGAELWRRLLALLPEGRPLAEMLMHLARLPAKSLECLMLAVIEQPEWARELLAGLGASDTEEDMAEWDSW